MPVPSTPSAAPAAIAQQGGVKPSTLSECLQDCFDQKQRNLGACKESCKVCSFSLFGFCWSWTTNQNCFELCQRNAEEIYQACAKECNRPPKA